MWGESAARQGESGAGCDRRHQPSCHARRPAGENVV